MLTVGPQHDYRSNSGSSDLEPSALVINYSALPSLVLGAQF